jgi:serine/threonine protein phosphatase PrpC
MHSFDIEDDDFVILGTDGLFDNMYPQDIYAAVRSSSLRDVSSNGGVLL